MTDKEFFDELKNDETILEKVYGDVSSFNFFRRNVGYKHDWEDGKLKARGLFVSNKTYEIVGRSYDKFFAINEREYTKLEVLNDKLHFPLDVYLKENGYLGILGYDKHNDDLIFASKASIGGPFAVIFEEIFKTKISDLEKVKRFLDAKKVSMVFEIEDPKRNPHIIEYKSTNIVLLDIVYREPTYRKMNYEDLYEVANMFGLKVKKKIRTIKDYKTLVTWYEKVMSEGYTLKGKQIEGFVIEDTTGYMLKLKLHWYMTWKKMRKVKDNMFKPNWDDSNLVLSDIQKEFYEWCKKMGAEHIKKRDIISLRKDFLKSK